MSCICCHIQLNCITMTSKWCNLWSRIITLTINPFEKLVKFASSLLCKYRFSLPWWRRWAKKSGRCKECFEESTKSKCARTNDLNIRPKWILSTSTAIKADTSDIGYNFSAIILSLISNSSCVWVKLSVLIFLACHAIHLKSAQHVSQRQ